METETRMYVGETGSPFFDGWAGFRIGQVYELRFQRQGNQVAVELDYQPGARTVVLGESEFEKCFIEK